MKIDLQFKKTVRKQGAAYMLLAAMLPVCGCQLAGTSSSTPEKLSGTAIHGGVYGGQQPIAGAAIYLYAAGTSGYGSAAQSLLSSDTSALNNGTSNVLTDGSGNGYVQTDSNGNFNITGDYSCPSNSQVYLLASGGSTASNGDLNPYIMLMAALGSCSFLKANAANIFANVNEVTTVAAAYALSQFMTGPTNLGTSSAVGALPGNATGLATAFGMFNNLANIATGTSPGSGQPTSGGGFAGLPVGMTVPSSTIAALADILAYCVNSDPAVSSNCATLMGDAKSRAAVTPANTLQAILNIAQNPGANVGALYLLISSSGSPFTTALGGAPNDWNLIVSITGGGMNGPNNIAADSNGNIWTANNSSTSLTEINPVTGFVSGTTGWSNSIIASPYGIAIDSSNNAWVTNTATGKGAIVEVSSDGQTFSGPFTGGGLTVNATPRGLAFDANGHLWAAVATIATSGTSPGVESLNEFSSAGAYMAGPIDVSGITTGTTPYAPGIDASGYIWVAQRSGNMARLTSAGAAVTGSPYTSNISQDFMVAFDSSGNAWAPNFGSASVVALAGSGNATPGAALATAFTGSGQISQPTFVTVDGLNDVWVANFGSGALCVSELNGSSTSTAGNGGTTTLGALLSAVCYGKGTLLTPHGFAIDAAGDLWIGGGSGNKIFTLIGAAAPVVNPIVTATANSQLGVRP